MYRLSVPVMILVFLKIPVLVVSVARILLIAKTATLKLTTVLIMLLWTILIDLRKTYSHLPIHMDQWVPLKA